MGSGGGLFVGKGGRSEVCWLGREGGLFDVKEIKAYSSVGSVVLGGGRVCCAGGWVCGSVGGRAGELQCGVLEQVVG